MHLQSNSGIFIVEDNLLYQQLIARELFLNETVVGLVVIERVNDVITVAPRVGIIQIAIQTGGLAIVGSHPHK